jgi:penicillin amidase
LNKFKRFLVLLVIFVVLSLTGFSVYMYYITNKSLPNQMGVILIDGLESKVEVNFDQLGIPQIWAQSDHDAWFTVGWLHASDRLFQMDLIRRVAEGKLSEILGERTLAFDQLQRKVGHRRMAERQLAQLDERSKLRLQAYVDGINSAVRNLKTLPFEYHLLRFDFEPWTLINCLSIFSYQTWYAHVLQMPDDFYLELMKQSSSEQVRDFMIPFPDWSFESVPNTLTRSSNAWVVAPHKTKKGHAILASDPHLDISMLPQFWYVIGIHGEQDSLDVLGLTSPGLPFVVYGRNRQTAWAFTAGGVDITDYYLEQISTHDFQQYRVGDLWQKFEQLQEIISVKGHITADTLLVKTGRHGPVLEQNDSLQQATCLYWAGFDRSISQGITAAFDLARVTNFKDFRDLITNFGALNANWVYADMRGNIGYQLGTPVPIRLSDRKPILLPGWDDRYNWQGYYPLEQTPHAYNSLQGWLATCNNQPGYAGDSLVAGNFAEDRILRITELLQSRNNLTAADMTGFQLDLISPSALRWKKEIVRVLKELGATSQVRIVEKWQGEMTVDSMAACIVETWLFNLKQLTFADEFRELAAVFNNRILFRDYVMEYLYYHGNQKWFDDRSTADRIESRDDIAQKAMRLTLQQVENKYWGDIQELSPAHPLAEIPLISQLFGLRRGPFARPGSPGTLNATTPLRQQNGKFAAIGGPSARMVFDFSDPDANTFMLPAGQSGNPVSKHFFDFYDRWEKGEVWNVPLSKESNYQGAVSNLNLEPLKSVP